MNHESIDYEVEDQRYGPYSVRDERNEGRVFVLASLALGVVLAALFFNQPYVLLVGGVAALVCFWRGVYQ